MVLPPAEDSTFACTPVGTLAIGDTYTSSFGCAARKGNDLTLSLCLCNFWFSFLGFLRNLPFAFLSCLDTDSFSLFQLRSSWSLLTSSYENPASSWEGKKHKPVPANLPHFQLHVTGVGLESFLRGRRKGFGETRGGATLHPGLLLPGGCSGCFRASVGSGSSPGCVLLSAGGR